MHTGPGHTASSNPEDEASSAPRGTAHCQEGALGRGMSSPLSLLAAHTVPVTVQVPAVPGLTGVDGCRAGRAHSIAVGVVDGHRWSHWRSHWWNDRGNDSRCGVRRWFRGRFRTDDLPVGGIQRPVQVLLGVPRVAIETVVGACQVFCVNRFRFV